MAEKKKNAKPIGKPNPFLYYLLAYVAGPIFRLVCRVKIDRSALQNIQVRLSSSVRTSPILTLFWWLWPCCRTVRIL